ncbi:hypothetical protein K2173_003280 [Erythroxylum novogranatense]|uniref:Protein kinase domain-containing protein n=1 Tax=Erythroxylum novogranatense TaxID=1862640 RepID=A0AAV8SX50_9ROSI|nr:hypothetical protein K2173_003280 [Erythroxylum novogranatense]
MKMDSKSLALLDRHLDKLWDVVQNYKLEVKEEWDIDTKNLLFNHVIARRAYATVHRAVYNGRDVVVKVLEMGQEDLRTSEVATQMKVFRQEVSTWAKLDHPNVSKFIGAFTDPSGTAINICNRQLAGNVCGIVSEYYPGGTLKSYLFNNRERKLPFKTVMHLALDLARGLAYLHSKNVVHRGIKAENMLLDEDQTLKVADFGVSRIQASVTSEMTGLTGTLGYMAPEVFENKPYTCKCDVYSFGICLWEIYCCDLPYPNLNFSELTSAVTYKNARPQIPKCCPKSLANVMRRCWDSDPNKRPEMNEVIATLEAIDPSKGKGMIPTDQRLGCYCFFRRASSP